MKGIDKLTIIFLGIVFFGWGISVLFDKLAANRMGTRGSIIYLVSSFPSILVLLFYLFWGYKIGNFDRTGVFWITASSVANIIALIAYYLVFTKAEVSWAVTVTALYPICTIILAYLFLHEAITIYRWIGILLAMIAIVFLSI